MATLVSLYGCKIRKNKGHGESRCNGTQLEDTKTQSCTMKIINTDFKKQTLRVFRKREN